MRSLIVAKEGKSEVQHDLFVDLPDSLQTNNGTMTQVSDKEATAPQKPTCRKQGNEPTLGPEQLVRQLCQATLQTEMLVW